MALGWNSVWAEVEIGTVQIEEFAELAEQFLEFERRGTL
jgi:hypothetical protein